MAKKIRPVKLPRTYAAPSIGPTHGVAGRDNSLKYSQRALTTSDGVSSSVAA